jgi:hypothetical protein
VAGLGDSDPGTRRQEAAGRAGAPVDARGNDDIVDDAFLRYFAFITDVYEWRLGRVPSGNSFENRALQLFGTEGTDGATSLSFLFDAPFPCPGRRG